MLDALKCSACVLAGTVLMMGLVGVNHVVTQDTGLRAIIAEQDREIGKQGRQIGRLEGVIETMGK